MRRQILQQNIGSCHDDRPFRPALAEHFLSDDPRVEIRHDESFGDSRILVVRLHSDAPMHGLLAQDRIVFLIPPKFCDDYIDFVHDLADRLEMDVWGGIGAVIGRPWGDD